MWLDEPLRTAELAGIRPAVISPSLGAGLDPFRGFRHVVRNVCAYVLDPRRIADLMDDLTEIRHAVHTQLADFADALETIAQAR